MKGRVPFTSSCRGGDARTPAPDSSPDHSPPPQGAPAGELGERDQWSPIVVDVPIYEFEPRPPRSREYVPDAIFDGWSTEHFTVRVASVRGYSHRYRGLPRQDHAGAAIHEQSGTCIFAVADGVSSAPQSHLGAATACYTAVDVIRWQIDHGYRAIDWDHVAEIAARELMSEATRITGKKNPDLSEAEALLATTLTAGWVMPSHGSAVGMMIQIGDSGAWILEEGTYHPLLRQKTDDDPAVISSAVSPLPRIPSPITPLEFKLVPGAALLVGSDGFGDPLGDGHGQVGRLFAGHLQVPPPPLGLAHLLDFSRETFDDDRTLVAIWARPREHGGT